MRVITISFLFFLLSCVREIIPMKTIEPICLRIQTGRNAVFYFKNREDYQTYINQDTTFSFRLLDTIVIADTNHYIFIGYGG